MLPAFLSPSALQSCLLWDPRYQLLKKQKSALLNSRVRTLLLLPHSHQDLEHHYFIVTAVKSTHITTSLNSSSILGNSRSSCVSPLVGPQYLYQEVVSDTLQKSGLLVSCCVGLPAGVRMFNKVPHRNRRPWFRDFLAFKESFVHILILRRVVRNRLTRVVPASLLILTHKLSFHSVLSHTSTAYVSAAPSQGRQRRSLSSLLVFPEEPVSVHHTTSQIHSPLTPWEFSWSPN